MNPALLTAVPAQLERYRNRALVAGIVGLAACAAGWFMDSERFFQAYLYAWVFCSGLALGALALLMLQHLTGGDWGLIIRRPLEAAVGTMPLVAVLFIPLVFGLHDLYEWTHLDAVADDAILTHKSAYLNTGFFLVRNAAYFLIWMGLAWMLRKLSHRQDVDGDKKILLRSRVVSGPGLVLLALTMTFASVDWIMSLEPHWYSTMFGALVLIGQIVSGLTLVLILVVSLSGTDPYRQVLKPGHIHDLGKLMLAFVMVWAYFSFSQFLIIWAGNLPEEIPWYLSRLNGGWEWAALALLLLHFVIPFLLLLSRSLKRNYNRLGRVALMVFLMHLVDVYWLITPAHGRALWDAHWLDLATPLGLGGIWLAFFMWQLSRHPLMPLRDPYFLEMIDDDHA